MSDRERPPNRRPCFTLKFRFITPSGKTFAFFGTVSFFGAYDAPDFNRPREIFVETSRAGTEMQYQLSETAIYASIALQSGATLEDLISSAPKISEKPERMATAVGYLLTLIRDGKLLPDELRLDRAKTGAVRLVRVEPPSDRPPEPAAPGERPGEV